jgi:hypothetical protein
MNELKKISKYVKRLIKRKPGIEDGIMRIKKNLHKTFHFYDVRLVNLASVLDGCREFRDWLNNLIISEPPSDDIVAVYFGLFRSEEGLQMYAAGSKIWSPKDPDWACRSDWRPEGRVLMPGLFKEITKVYSEFNLAGYYRAVAYMVLMILDFSRESMISLLDDKRKAMHVACGFDDGELFNVGVLHDGGLLTLREAIRRGLLPGGGTRKGKK